MKKLAPLFVILVIGFQSFAQVGINTTDPTATLDVNGDIRVRSANLNGNLATKIIGVDENGNFVEVEIADNLVLENNFLRAVDEVSDIGDIPVFTIPILNDVDLIILPGEPNDNKTVVRLASILGNITLTGLLPGVNGQKVWLYPTTGDLMIWTNSLLSLLGNRIEGSGIITVERYEMIQLIYDGARSKWIIMNY